MSGSEVGSLWEAPSVTAGLAVERAPDRLSRAWEDIRLESMWEEQLGMDCCGLSGWGRRRDSRDVGWGACWACWAKLCRWE